MILLLGTNHPIHANRWTVIDTFATVEDVVEAINADRRFLRFRWEPVVTQVTA